METDIKVYQFKYRMSNYRTRRQEFFRDNHSHQRHHTNLIALQKQPHNLDQR